MRYFIIIVFSTLIASCDLLAPVNDSEGEPVARVGEFYLDKSELDRAIPESLSGDDSIQFRKRFIKNWIKDKLITSKAIDNLTEEQLDKSIETQNYYHALIRNEYYRQLMSQNLDLDVDTSELRRYFDENQNNFKLQKPILRLRWLRVEAEKDNEEIADWIMAADISDRDSLYRFAVQRSIDYYLDEEQWLAIDKLHAKLPFLQSYDNNYLNSTPFIKHKDSLGTYYVKVVEFRKEGDDSPFQFVKNDIRNIILNKSKIELIRELEENVYREGIEKNEFEVYEN